MKHDFSLKKNLALLIEAFRGTREARNSHRRIICSPVTVQSALVVLRERWPDLKSPNQSAPIFVLSAGWRSGSTFLQRWAMTREDILVWGEPYARAGLVPSLAGQLKAFTQNWPQDESFADRRHRGDNLTQAWVANLYPSLTDFINAHIDYLETLFLKPALALGKSRWGLKEVKLGVEHAHYLQWLFPNAKFLFLYRDPYHAYGSYRKWRDWYRTWPDDPVFTATRFGAVWKELVTDFLTNHDKVGGLLLRYEDLRMQATKSRIEDYLGLQLADASSLARVTGNGVTTRAQHTSHWMPRLERLLLKRQVEPLSRQLGYRSP